MKKIKHICFIVPNYPTKIDPMYTFVRELICEFADSDVKCSVIAPQSITNYINKRWRKRPLYWVDYTDENNAIEIYQPITAHFFKTKISGNTISGFLTERACKRAFKNLDTKPDILYAHFWHSGVIAGELGRKYNIPYFIASGESKIWVESVYSKRKIMKNCNYTNGVIAVSSKNKDESIDLGLISEEKIKVIPNAINSKRFYRKNKNKAKKRLGLKQSDFVVAFTGAFTERKGVNRLSEALNRFNDVKSIFIGKGNMEPNCNNIIFKGKLSHDEIVNYLNAADVFVLPSLAEGCSNAIIEAMACGLPIISSNKKFNDDILHDSNSIRINSEDVDEIYLAIKKLKNDESKRNQLSESSFKLSQELTLSKRSKKIMSYIENNI